MRPRRITDPVTGKVRRSKKVTPWQQRARPCTCGAKQTYTSKKVAKAIAREQSKASGETIEAYHCFGAHGYHIGHPIGSRNVA